MIRVSLTCVVGPVMEYLAGGEVKWRNDNEEPILTVEQTRRIIRDAVLGLQYRAPPFLIIRFFPLLTPFI